MHNQCLIRERNKRRRKTVNKMWAPENVILLLIKKYTFLKKEESSLYASPLIRAL